MALRYYLACVILSFSLVTGQSTRYELRGQKVSLKPDIRGTPESILWKRNGNKVVEFNGQEQDEYGQYKNRVSVDWHTADLEITDLRIEDSGDYELEVYMNKKLSTSLHKLEVIDRVAKATISCEMNDGGDSNKSGTLLCSAEPRQPQSLMTFEWRSHGNVQPGKKLTISLGDKYDNEVYSCRVSNPLSRETATFTAKDCYPETSSILIGVLVTIAVLSLLLMGLGIICCKQHNKACFAKGNRDDPEKRGATEGSDGNPADERMHLIVTTSPNPSTQRSNQGHDGDLQDETLKKGHVKDKIKLFDSSFRGKTPPIRCSAGSQIYKDRNHLANNNKDADEDQLRESAETEVPQSENAPEPAAVLTNTTSSTAAEQSESDKETAEDDEKRPPLDTTVTPPTTQPLDHVGDSDTVKDLEKNKDENEGTESPPSTTGSESHSPLDPSNPACNDKGDADADQLSEPTETEVPHHDSSDSEEENETKPADMSIKTMSDLESSTASEHQDLEKDEEEEGKSPLANVSTPVPKPRSQLPQATPNTVPEVTAGGQKKDANSDQVNAEPDTSGVGEPHESGSSSEDKQLPPLSEQKDSETTPHDQDPNLCETHTSEDNQQEMLNKSVPAAEKESGSEGNSEEPDLYSASHQPQSSTPTKPDNRSKDTLQESPDAEHEEPVQGEEGKTAKESEKCSESEHNTGEDKK